MTLKPAVGTLLHAPSRAGAVARLLTIGAILGFESLLMSGLIDDPVAGTLGNQVDLVRTAQHWLFRYLIAYSVSFGMLIVLRGVASEPIFSGDRTIPIRYRWLLVHLALFLPFVYITGLYKQGTVLFLWIALAWHLCAAAVVVSLCAVMAPAEVWLTAIRRTGKLPLFALLPAAGALLAFRASQLLWRPASSITFDLVQIMLRPFYPTLQTDPTTLTLITEHFAVTVSEVCSGLEGVGLMLAFCLAWLWYFRREFIFPRAFVIIPGAVLVIFLLNAVRIAALVMIGEAGYQRVASVGFHSQAGWIAFNGAAFAVAIVAKRTPWLNRTARETNHAISDATPAYLVPLLAILAAGMIAHALSAGFDLLYPLRLVCAAFALWVFRDRYRALDWRCSWRGVIVGVLIFFLWLLFAYFLSTTQQMPEDLLHLNPSLRNGWIICRIAAATLTVPIAEELAYRGYLMRRVAVQEFEVLPFGDVRLPALFLSSIAFGVTHGSLWLPGIMAGFAYGALAVKTGKIGESVVAHATTNSLIAATVLLVGQWQLW